MNVLWFSWKDINHPLAGGAEIVSYHLMKNLVADGHKVTLITSGYPGATAAETVDGVDIVRLGGKFSVYFRAYRFFRKNLRDWPDLVIDEMNTIPFGCAFYTKKRTVLLTYQLARKVWFYQMLFPLSLIGYLLEPLYLFTLSRKYKKVLTESQSTRKDLKKFGFPLERTKVFRIGMALRPVATLPPPQNLHTVLFLGALRPMKQPLHAIQAFEKAHDKNNDLMMVLAGSDTGRYGKKVKTYISRSRHKEAISIRGRVTDTERLALLREASLIVVTSVKEGWGLIVTEANSQGTPAIAYDVDGLRDSIQNDKTGVLVKNGDISSLGVAMLGVLSDKNEYEKLRENAWAWSKEFTFDNSYTDFLNALN